MNRCACPERRRPGAALWLAAALALGHAGAQAQAEPEPCALPQTFVEVAVAGQARGGALALIDGERVWLSPGVLREAEAGYADARVRCDDQDFVRLNAALEVRFDPGELTLSVGGRTELLPNNTLDLGQVRPPEAEVLPTLPVTTLGVQGEAARRPGEAGQPAVLTHSAAVRAGYQNGRLALGAQLGEAGGQGLSTAWQGQLSAAYQVRDNLSVEVAAYAVRVAGGPVRLADEQISGLTVTFGSVRAYRLPQLVLALPLDAEVELRVPGVEVPRLNAAAGTLTIRNLPLDLPAGTVELRIRDATGTRFERVTYTAADIQVTAQALAVRAQAGLRGTRPAAQATAVYGLNDAWSLSAELDADTARQQLKASARYVVTDLNTGFGVQYDSATRTRLLLSGDATWARGEWRFGAGAVVPPLDLRAASVSGQVGWSARGTSLGLRAQATPGAARGELGLSASRKFSADLSVALGAAVSTNAGQLGWRATLSATWTPTPRLGLNAAATAENGSTLLETRAVYQLAPEHTLNAGVVVGSGAARAATVGYQYVGQGRAAAQLSTTGEARVSGSVGAALVGGQLYLTAAETGPGVLVRTGVAGVPLVVGGVPVVTDRRGDALVLLASGTRVAAVAPDFEQLPVTVSVQEDGRTLSLSPYGVTVLDWTGNFARFAWVRLLRPDGTPLKYARLALKGDPTTDDEGWALVPEFSAPQTVQATEEDPGAPPCQVQLIPGTETVTCVPIPPAAP
ncbi:hypothetical protein [Deinococcus arcticus]|uniref:Fimbrial biogenesis outer membrane usher protein n=1 Tax=Deinococcus arcticus TaxID=2136176 RepID=A0A2T3WA65_9DEIO|nr:hypothetical protein [Deinococcus arcticus]PTA68684.1 hypothetical protein C8263_05385 [Deinococcus arcticus]